MAKLENVVNISLATGIVLTAGSIPAAFAYRGAKDTSWRARFGVVCPVPKRLIPDLAGGVNPFPPTGILWHNASGRVECTDAIFGLGATVRRDPVTIVSLPPTGKLQTPPDESVFTLTGRGQDVSMRVAGSTVTFSGFGVSVTSQSGVFARSAEPSYEPKIKIIPQPPIAA